MAGTRPVFTENFSANLSAIQAFLGQEGEKALKRLLDRLFDEVVPTLCRFPLSGRAFLAHTISSSEATAVVRKLRDQLEQPDTLREFILDDYIILYLVRGETDCFSLDQTPSPIVFRSETILARLKAIGDVGEDGGKSREHSGVRQHRLFPASDT